MKNGVFEFSNEILSALNVLSITLYINPIPPFIILHTNYIPISDIFQHKMTSFSPFLFKFWAIII